MTKAKATVQELETKPKYYYYIVQDGQEVKVQRDVELDKFKDKDVTLYHYTVVDKAGATVDKYAITLDEYKANKPPRATKESVQSMLASGMTPEQIVAKIAGL